MNSGSAPGVYMPQYLKIFRTPEPNSSTRPTSLKNVAITGFLGKGEKLDGSIMPLPLN